MRISGGIIIAVAFAIFFLPFASTVHAANSPVSHGLSISPVGSENTVTACKPHSGMVTVSNLTDSPMKVTLSVEQFSVSPYSYDYSFQSPDNDWIKLSVDSVSLQPSESKQVIYDVETSSKVAPGGYYYTVVASADIESGQISSTVQATSLIYITVNGNLVRTSVQKNASIPWFITTPNIPFKFDVLDTGNVHFQAFFFGQLQSIFGSQPQVGSNNLVFPGKVRTISGSIPSPSWPGVYRVTYGYKVDFADITIAQSSYILYLPPWSMVAIVIIVLAFIWSLQASRRAKQKSSLQD